MAGAEAPSRKTLVAGGSALAILGAAAAYGVEHLIPLFSELGVEQHQLRDSERDFVFKAVEAKQDSRHVAAVAVLIQRSTHNFIRDRETSCEVQKALSTYAQQVAGERASDDQAKLVADGAAPQVGQAAALVGETTVSDALQDAPSECQKPPVKPGLFSGVAAFFAPKPQKLMLTAAVTHIPPPPPPPPPPSRPDSGHPGALPTKAAPAPPPGIGATRVFFQTGDKSDKSIEIARQEIARLRGLNPEARIADGIEPVSTFTGSTQVRYFFAGDQPQAAALASQLSAVFPEVRCFRIGGYDTKGTAHPGLLEVWLKKNAEVAPGGPYKKISCT